jgi:hypothetical protein
MINQWLKEVKVSLGQDLFHVERPNTVRGTNIKDNAGVVT